MGLYSTVCRERMVGEKIDLRGALVASHQRTDHLRATLQVGKVVPHADWRFSSVFDWPPEIGNATVMVNPVPASPSTWIAPP